MLRQRLVRQSALSSTDTPPLDGCSSSRPSLFRPVSSDSFERLIEGSPKPVERNRERRHSVACGVTVIDVEKPTFRNALNSAVRRMSTACSYLVSSSQPSLSNTSTSEHKNDQVVLPAVLDTFRCRKSSPKSVTFDSNRRFSTDFPPPSYQEATAGWKLSNFVKVDHDLYEVNDVKEISFKKVSVDPETSPPDLREVVSE